MRATPGAFPPASASETRPSGALTSITYEPENRWQGTRNRILQAIAREAPGAETTRVRLHRARGVNIGANVWIGYDVVLETGFPHLITIGDNSTIGVRAMIIAHFNGIGGVTLEHDVFLGPGVIVMPSVVVGQGSTVAAGSVVSRSIPELTFAQGNPAVPVAKLSTPFRRDMPGKDFFRIMRPLR